MSEPSWADKTVDRYIANHGHDFTVYDVMRLLRAERSRARRIVREIRRAEVDGLNIRQYLEACDDILAMLE